VINGGIISPGTADAGGISAIGQLTVGTLTANTGSELFLQIGGATIVDAAGVASYKEDPLNFVVPASWTNYEAGVTLHDQLLISDSGAPTLDTVIRISDNYLNSFMIAQGQVFQFVDWSSLGTNNILGTTTFNLPTLSDDLSWETGLFRTHGVIFVVPEPSRALLMLLGMLALGFRRRRF